MGVVYFTETDFLYSFKKCMFGSEMQQSKFIPQNEIRFECTAMNQQLSTIAVFADKLHTVINRASNASNDDCIAVASVSRMANISLKDR